MTTNHSEATAIKTNFLKIKARGGHAAIDYNTNTGELVLMCTRPDWNKPETWGRGSLPQTYNDAYLRLMEC